MAGGLIPLTLGRKAPDAYLRVNLTLEMDDLGTYLAVAKSSVAVYADESGRHMLCHHDYERGASPRLPGLPEQSARSLTTVGRSAAAVGSRRPPGTRRIDASNRHQREPSGR